MKYYRYFINSDKTNNEQQENNNISLNYSFYINHKKLYEKENNDLIMIFGICYKISVKKLKHFQIL